MEKRELREQFMALEYMRKELMKPYFIDLGLTIGQGQPRILSHLLTEGGMTQRELADACSLDATTLSRTLDRMCDADLVVREPHEQSRRAYQVELTGEGRKLAQEVSRGYEALDEVLCKGFTAEEQEGLLTALRRIEENLSSVERIADQM